MGCELDKVVKAINKVASEVRDPRATNQLNELKNDLSKFATSMETAKPARDFSKLKGVMSNVEVKSTASGINSNVKVVKLDDLKIKPVFSDAGVKTIRDFKTTEHFGNPFLSTRNFKDKGVGTDEEVAKMFSDWLKGVSNKDVEPKRREWIIKQILDGNLDNKPLLYYANTPVNHAKELEKLINNKSLLSSDSSSSSSSSIKPINTTISRPEFDKLPFYKEGQKTMTYAGIGSRETPIDIQKEMYRVGKELESLGFTGQSGGAPGADKAFEGANQPWEKEDGTVAGTKEFTKSKANVTRWAQYGKGRNSPTNMVVFKATDSNDTVRKIAKEIHPKKQDLSEKDGLNLHARNTFQVFGKNLDTPVDFVLFYAEEQKGLMRPKGGTGQAVEMARLKGIPTINMATSGWKEQLEKVLDSSKESASRKAPEVTNNGTNEEIVSTDVDSETDKYIDTMLSKINPTFKVETDPTLFEKYISGEVSGFAHYNAQENKIVIPILPEFTKSNRVEYAGKILYNKLGFKTNGSDHNYLQKRYGTLTEYNTYDMTNWFEKVLKSEPDSVIEYAEGYYTTSTATELYNNMITTGFLSEGVMNRVVRHEKVHAYTIKFLNENPDHEVTKSVKRLYREALSKVPAKGDKTYWRKNVNEFVAEAISNPEVRDTLKVITTEQVKNKVSIFDRLVELILKSLGVSRGNIYSELLYALNNIPTDNIEGSKLVESKNLSRYKNSSNIAKSIEKIIDAYDTAEFSNVVTTRDGEAKRRALWFGEESYEYSGKRHEATAMHPYVTKIARDIEKETEMPVGYFNSVLINEYKSGKGLKAHRDNESIFIDKDNNIGEIATLTLSGEGKVTIYDNKGKEVESHKVNAGDLYVMPGKQFQNNFRHKVDTVGKDTRISLTFRHIPNNDTTTEVQSKKEVEVSTKFDEKLDKKIANKLKAIYKDIEVMYLNGQNEMRAVLEEVSGGIALFQLSKKRKEEFEKKLRKARPELDGTGLDKILRSIEEFSEVESNGNEKLMKKLELLALHWTIKGNVILPEDGSKVIQALKIAEKNKFDPFSYNSPNDITESFAKVEDKVKPLDPDDYIGKGYSNRRELPKGITVYDVDNTDTGREVSRAMIDTHFGKDANPWCLLARKNGDIKETATFWYDNYPGEKKIAFKDGKLVAFYGDNQWWDRMDNPSDDIAIESKLEKDSEGRTPIEINYVSMYDESSEKINNTYDQKRNIVKFIRGNRNNGIYEEWSGTSKNSSENLELKEIRKSGVLKYSKKTTTNIYDGTDEISITINDNISKDMIFKNDISEYHTNEIDGKYRYSEKHEFDADYKTIFAEIEINSNSKLSPHYTIRILEDRYSDKLRYTVTDFVGYAYDINKESFDSLFNEIKLGKTTEKYTSLITELDKELIIPFQKDEDIIKGAAVISKKKILIDIENRSTDTLAHEYAHFYIAAFRDTAIVQEAIKKWGNEEALVQAIGEQVVSKKGAAYGFWKRFTKWVRDLVSNLDKATKEDLVKALTDAFLTNTNLREYSNNSNKNIVNSKRKEGIIAPINSQTARDIQGCNK